VNIPSAKNYSSRFAVCEVLHLDDALSGQALADGRDGRTHEAGDPHRQMIEYKRENAPAIGETIAHFATHSSLTGHGLQIVRVGYAEIPFLHLEHVPRNHSMVAAQLLRGELALPRYCLPVVYHPFYEYKRVYQDDVIQRCFAPPSVLPLVKRRSKTQE
jgi:hypothetical protein